MAAGQTVAANVLAGVTQLTLDDSASTFAALAGGLTVFAVNDGTNGQEPWVTDGTKAGTHLLAALAPGVTSQGYQSPGLTDPAVRGSYFTVKGSRAEDFGLLDPAHALFSAFDPSGTLRLWITDGTAAGTRIVTTAVAPYNYSVPTPLGDGRALFSGMGTFPNNTGNELWVTDGTAAGTRQVTDINPGTAGSQPSSFVAIGGGRAVFGAFDGEGNRLFVTDATAAGTVAVPGPTFATGLTRLGTGTVVFTGQDAAHGREPWITDGTTAGTHLIANTVPGTAGSVVSNYGALGNGRAVFFINATAGTSNTDRQLWVTDGTAAGTTFIKDFGINNVSVPNFGLYQLADGRVAFTAGIGTAAAQSWVTDGTASGTQVIGGTAASSSLGGSLTGLSGAALVDAPFYYAHNADVAAAGVVSATHYDQSGWHEGRDPSALFSTAGYLGEYKDVAAAGVDPLTHYDQSGWREGRDPSAAFDTNLYLLFNPDVRAAGLDPLAHYLAFGQAEGRRMSFVVDSARVQNLFDPTFYGLSNSDVTAAGADLLTHFNAHGAAEGRNPDAFFDVTYYLAHNPDVAASGINPVAHYLNVGWTEGRDPSSHFSTNSYLNAYADVRAAGVNPLQHFLQNGIIEGRSAFGDRF